MRCPHCGRNIPDNRPQCIYCGTRLDMSHPGTNSENKTNILPIAGFFVLMVAILLLLIFDPFHTDSSDEDGPGGQTSQEAAPDSGDSDSNAGNTAGGSPDTDGNDADAGTPSEDDNPATADTSDNGNGGQTDTPPAKDPDTAASVLDPEKLRQIMDRAGSDVNYSVCITDLNTGSYTGVNASDPTSASAMVAVPILYAAAYEIDRGDLSLSDKITFHYSVGGRGKLKKSDNGRSLSLESLLQAMLEYSDNNATNTLIDYFGMDTLESICHKNGFDSVRINGRLMETKDNTSSDNYISAKDLCGMIYQLYSNKFSGGINRSFLTRYMHLQDGSDDSGLCGSIHCDYYNLNGVKNNKYNEIAIIDNNVTPYAIAYLANDADMERLQEVAATLGEYVHKRVDSIGE